MITLIGDAHGLFRGLNKKVRKLSDRPVIQVGDLGLGFNKKRDPKRRFADNFRFIRGNHDDPAICRANPSYLGDYGYLPEHRAYFISGADSVDKYKRVEGVDWWRDEQLEYSQFASAIAECLFYQPKLIITHDCPQFLYETVTDGKYSRYGQIQNNTAQAYDCLFEQYKPKLWVFGHHHKDKMIEHEGTTFVCLPELATLHVDIDSL